MHTIDLAKLTTVIGGCQCQQQQAQPQQAPEQSAQAGPAGGSPTADVMGGAQQLLGFFQSDGFKQLLGGLQSLVGGGAAQK